PPREETDPGSAGIPAGRVYPIADVSFWMVKGAGEWKRKQIEKVQRPAGMPALPGGDVQHSTFGYPALCPPPSVLCALPTAPPPAAHRPLHLREIRTDLRIRL